MSETVFDAIVRGDIPCHKLYEDDRALCFLDIQPLTRGHALVIPKRGGAKLQDLAPEDAAHLMVVAQRVVPVLLDAVGALDATLAMHDGPTAGQEVPYVHLHIIPRNRGDGGGPVHALFAARPHVDGDELARLAEQVQDSLEIVAEPA